ncbi:hypothetical protein HYH03_011249 [Edaphochlamys debaryana]|uniref:Protein kinase domain-containing protein n=1 Tax=Edaphochlamys debaryana TaxID=47281 RepID=A0A835XWG0_9CHLO|nr:hypothetical protein HYH03_011249 [Edaphochlamys debaryana]|eukprot:KAG2490298.1 hypothetical protein HYH03_011249 [Edaphochlamys debaryana]
MVSLLLLEGDRRGAPSSTGPAPLLSNSGWAPEQLAACANRPAALRALHQARPSGIDTPAGPEAGPFAGWTPLACAVACGAAEAVRVLLGELGAGLGSLKDPYSPICLVKSRDAWLAACWELRGGLPRFLTAAEAGGVLDPLRDLDGALESFQRVREAFQETLEPLGIKAVASGEACVGPSAWDYVVDGGELELHEQLVAGEGAFGDVRRAECMEVVGRAIDPQTEHMCIVMPWYPLDLRRQEEGLPWGQPPRLTPRKRLEIALHVAEGLALLHAHRPEPIVHRDVKPGGVGWVGYRASAWTGLAYTAGPPG